MNFSKDFKPIARALRNMTFSWLGVLAIREFQVTKFGIAKIGAVLVASFVSGVSIGLSEDLDRDKLDSETTSAAVEEISGEMDKLFSPDNGDPDKALELAAHADVEGTVPNINGVSQGELMKRLDLIRDNLNLQGKLDAKLNIGGIGVWNVLADSIIPNSLLDGDYPVRSKIKNETWPFLRALVQENVVDESVKNGVSKLEEISIDFLRLLKTGNANSKESDLDRDLILMSLDEIKEDVALSNSNAKEALQTNINLLQNLAQDAANLKLTISKHIAELKGDDRRKLMKTKTRISKIKEKLKEIDKKHHKIKIQEMEKAVIRSCQINFGDRDYFSGLDVNGDNLQQDEEEYITLPDADFGLSGNHGHGLDPLWRLECKTGIQYLKEVKQATKELIDELKEYKENVESSSPENKVVAGSAMAAVLGNLNGMTEEITEVIDKYSRKLVAYGEDNQKILDYYENELAKTEEEFTERKAIVKANNESVKRRLKKLDDFKDKILESHQDWLARAERIENSLEKNPEVIRLQEYLESIDKGIANLKGKESENKKIIERLDRVDELIPENEEPA